MFPFKKCFNNLVSAACETLHFGSWKLKHLAIHHVRDERAPNEAARPSVPFTKNGRKSIPEKARNSFSKPVSIAKRPEKSG